MAQLHFNAETVAPDAGFTPLPAGIYTTMITDSEVKLTRSGGEMAVFTLQVIDGEHRGRRLFARINTRNPSAEAERIGQGQLSSLCRAVGVMQLTDTAQLHGKPVRVRVIIRKDDTGQYGDQNEVKGFEPVDGGQSGAMAAAVAPRPATAAPAAAQPWKRVGAAA